MNQLQFEQIGIPTITVITPPFLELAESTMEGKGFADMPFLIVPHPMGMIKEDEIRAKADEAFPDLLKIATEWQPERTEIPNLGKPAYPAETIKFTGTFEDVNDMFYERGWSLGLLIIPPTRDRVAEMLKGTSHSPDEIIWVIPPREGILTVELVAVNGVMAGCKPEHMPLLLAIAEAMSDPGYNWRFQTTTTHQAAPFILVNGPIRHELDIAYGTGAAGPRQPTNMCVGHFVNLIGDIVGGSVTPSPDKSDQGWAGNIIATVVGENEEASPWEPYHVERGFDLNDNVVTLSGGAPPNVNWDHASNNAIDLAENLALLIAGTGTGGGCLSSSREGFLVLAPEHAQTIAADGWTKDDLREFLWDKARLPYWSYPGKPDGKPVPPFTCEPPEDFGPYTDDTLIPVLQSPASIHIAVMGGDGKHSQFWDGMMSSPAVSVLIDKWR
ncbi:MAG: thiol-disulfide oxidoreductase [Deltaproteobacteria bacterium]|nr:thiol-disulfide oxidoreductase [Deltaproteobacteria bacterium]